MTLQPTPKGSNIGVFLGWKMPMRYPASMYDQGKRCHSDNTVEVMRLSSNPLWAADQGKRGVKA